MIGDIENEIIGTVIVKDLSRLGRNYLQVGYYTEMMFPRYDVRFISVTDNVDSNVGYSEFVPIHNLMNDWYVRDISRKQRAVIQSKGNSGKRLTNKVIFGYKKDDDGQWIIDDEAAKIVKKIFQMCLDGYGIQMIANYLYTKKIRTPSAYASKLNTDGVAEKNPFLWSAPTVANILSKQEYCGDTVNFRTQRKSCMSKQIIHNSPDDYKIFYNTHDAIISREDFEKVQEIRSKRKRISPIQEPVLFREIYCADCGSHMYVMRTRDRKKTNPNYYLCSNYRKASSPCNSHYIRENYLIEYVLKVLNSLLEQAQSKETFIAKINNEITKRNGKKHNEMKKNLATSQKRVSEIDKIIKELYEDKVRGNISLEIFQKLSNSFLQEQKELTELMIEYNKECLEIGKNKLAMKEFFEIVDRYLEQGIIDNLTREIVDDFIERIEVFEAEKIDGKRQPQVNIYFKGIGLLSD